MQGDGMGQANGEGRSEVGEWRGDREGMRADQVWDEMVVLLIES